MTAHRLQTLLHSRKHRAATQVYRHGLGAGETLATRPHLYRNRLLRLLMKNHNDGGVST